MKQTYKARLNKRFKLLKGLLEEFPSFNVDLKYQRDTELDRVTNFCFDISTIDDFKDYIKPLSEYNKSYAIARLYNLKMSEMMEYFTLYALYDLYTVKKCDRYDRYADVVVDGFRYDVKCVSVNWSGNLYRNYNSKYIYVKYSSKKDFADISKLKTFIENIQLSMFDGTNLTISL